MCYKRFSSFITLLFISGAFLFASAKIEGFYKDVFQDEGTQINGGNLEIDCAYIGYNQEHLDTEDKTLQASVMIKAADDANGYFLYPDGAPRFAIMYYHGGMMGHATDLGAEGIKLVRTHYFNGGCQFGSCAGSFMLSNNASWFNIWPGKMDGPNVSNTPIDAIIQPGSYLIGINNFKEGDIIKSVYHNNGGSVDTAKAPKGTTFGSMHNSGTLKGYGELWSYKHHDTTGRVVGFTGHPEGSSQSDQVRYISAVMLYISKFFGNPRIKSTLKNGELVTMDKKWEDNAPKNTAIGDRQYHHFILECKDASNVKLVLTGKDGFDFQLFVAKDTFAFKQKALFADSTAGAVKTLTIPQLSNGIWYIGVKLNTTVTADTTNKGFPKYSGKTEVLNGIPYTLKATWDGVNILASRVSIHNQFGLAQKNRMVIISTGSSLVQSLKIFDLKGRLCWEPSINADVSRFAWQPSASGAYIIRVVSGKEVLTKRITVAQR